MTSSITVKACVASNKQVRVKQSDGDDIILQDGESFERAFYDEIVISTNEEVKVETVADAAVQIGGDGPVKP